MRLALLAAAAMLAVACGSTSTENHLHLDRGSVRIMEDLRRVQLDGQMGDASGGTGAGATAGAGGEGKLSPGGSNMVDGFGNATFIFMLGGETPSELRSALSADPAVVVQSPNSTATTAGDDQDQADEPGDEE